jgi:hypothetical protein
MKTASINGRVGGGWEREGGCGFVGMIIPTHARP